MHRRLTAAAGVLGAALVAAAPASALNYVNAANGDQWAISDAAIPGLDTGSVHNTRTGSLQGFGGLRVRVSGTSARLNGALMRGFGLRFDGVDRFTTTTGVDLGGVTVSRAVRIDRTGNWARWVDTFTNTTPRPITVEAVFGGQAGYNTGTNQSKVVDSSSGDAALTAADAWAEVATGNPSPNGPSAVVSGTITRTADFLREPFDTPLATSGDEANHYGYLNRFQLAPNTTKSLVRFVVSGLSETRTPPAGGAIPAAGSQIAAVRATAAALAATPEVSDLTTAQKCSILNFTLAGLACSGVAPLEPPARALAATAPVTSSPYDVVDKTITEMQADMAAGRATSQQITRAYLDRIGAYDTGQFGFHSFIAVAADAMAQAKAADTARAAGAKGALLGIPIGVKDIYDTKDMPTTGGSLVFEGFRPVKDAYQVARLRAAGAVILGKTNLAEFATDGHFSPSAWGQVWNAFDPSRSSIGSSGGSAVAVAASLVGAAFGTQTGDSLWGPSSAASLYSLRGTDGIASTDGVMPLTWGQDFAGMIARSLPDLASLLNATTGTNPDDFLTAEADAHKPADWSATLNAGALQGKRIGYYASAFVDPFGTTGTTDAMKASFQFFRDAGATVVEIPAPPSAPSSVPGDRGYEGWARWVAAHPENPYQNPVDIITSPKRVPLFRSATYTGTGPMTDTEVRNWLAFRAEYRTRLAKWMDDNAVDAVVFGGELSDIHLNDSIQPSFGRIDPQASASGVPTVIFPTGRNDHGQPINLQLEGRPWDDGKLMGYAYAFDRRAHGHVAPDTAPRLSYAPGVEPLPVAQPTPAPAPVTVAAVPEQATNAVTVKAPPALRLAGSVVRADRKGRFTLRLTCSGGPCTARLSVRRNGKAFATRTLTVTKTIAVRVTAPAAARRSLAHGSTVRLGVSLAGLKGTAIDGRAVTVSVRPQVTQR